MILELIFWLTILGLWITVVIKGLAWFERTLDSYLDRWFVGIETNYEGDV
jgi:hypothetical protein